MTPHFTPPGKYGKTTDFPVDQQRRLVIFIARHGSGPWKCCYCHRKVVNLVIHHLDENHWNDNPDNLAPIHKSCHARIHHKGKRSSDDTRRKIHKAAIKIAADPAERKRRSERAKKQHREGKFGRKTWSAGTAEEVAKKNKKSMKRYVRNHPEHIARMLGDSAEMSKRSYQRKLFKGKKQ